MKKKGKKVNNLHEKAISPLIATVLIIGFTILLGAFVMTWGLDLYKNYQDKTSKDSEVALKCAETNFNINEACIIGNKVNIVLENVGNTEISGFLYRIKSGKNMHVSHVRDSLGIYSKQNFFEADFPDSLGTPKEVEIFPKIIVKDKEPIVCDYPKKKEVSNCYSLLNFESAAGFVNSAGNIEKSIPGSGQSPYFALTPSEELGESPILKSVLLSSLPRSEYSLVTMANTNENNPFVLSNPFKIPTDEKISNMMVYLETNDNVIYKLVNVENPTDELILYNFGVQGQTTYQNPRIPLNNFKGKNVKLKIDFSNTISNNAIGILYRFCYTDLNSASCI